MAKTSVPGLAFFAARLRVLRACRRVDQRWVAREAGISHASVAFLELGKCCPSAENLARLADMFGVSMDELWRGTGRCEGVGVLRDERGRP